VSDDGRNVVIRPLIYCDEAHLAELAAKHRFPILPCNLCGSQSEAQRKQMKAMLADLESKHPTLRQTMLAAMGNVNPSHLFDKKLHPRHDAPSLTETESVAEVIAPASLLRAT
jgi:tRNA 2-thiocytidine biosynthesis protein TtcA